MSESEELEKALLHELLDEVKNRTEIGTSGLPYYVDLCDERELLAIGNPDEFYDARFETIMELILKIRKLDGLTDNIAHPLIDEIVKVEDYSLERQVTMLTKLLEETSVRHSEGLPPPFKIPNIFAFKIEDKKGRMHLFNCDAQSLTQLKSAIKLKVRDEVPRILVEKDNKEIIEIASDNDLTEALKYARSVRRKVLKLHLDYSISMEHDHGESVSMYHDHVESVSMYHDHVESVSCMEYDHVELVGHDHIQPVSRHHVQPLVSAVGLGVIVLAVLCKFKSN